MLTPTTTTNFRTCPTHLKEVAYKQLVLPLLEYCAPIWEPHNKIVLFNYLKMFNIERLVLFSTNLGVIVIVIVLLKCYSIPEVANPADSS